MTVGCKGTYTTVRLLVQVCGGVISYRQRIRCGICLCWCSTNIIQFICYIFSNNDISNIYYSCLFNEFLNISDRFNIYLNYLLGDKGDGRN